MNQEALEIQKIKILLGDLQNWSAQLSEDLKREQPESLDWLVYIRETLTDSVSKLFQCDTEELEKELEDRLTGL